MNSIQTPIAIRATSSALAVFMTIATLSSLISMAEPQQSELIAQTAARQAARVAATPRQAEIVAQVPMTDVDH